jgi:hypothetical protein
VATEALADQPPPLVARLGPPPVIGEARIVWARTAAATAAALEAPDLSVSDRRRLAAEVIAEGRDELAVLGTPVPASPSPTLPPAPSASQPAPDAEFTPPDPWDAGPDHGPSR